MSLRPRPRPAGERIAAHQEEGAAFIPGGKNCLSGGTERAPGAGHAPERIVYAVLDQTMATNGQVLQPSGVEVATYWT